MTRLIDADALNYVRVRIAHDDGTIGGYNAVVPSSEIKNAPTIDAVPVIRCKDCKWWPYHPIERQIGYVKTFLCAIPPASKEAANGFCSMAERREE